jgi:hypothetical protein
VVPGVPADILAATITDSLYAYISRPCSESRKGFNKVQLGTISCMPRIRKVHSKARAIRGIGNLHVNEAT